MGEKKIVDRVGNEEWLILREEKRLQVLIKVLFGRHLLWNKGCGKCTVPFTLHHSRLSSLENDEEHNIQTGKNKVDYLLTNCLTSIYPT